MRKLILAISATLLLSAQASPNPVIEHYRAYTAAVQAGDMASAEREAAAALQASMSRDGNGGRTGVLAVNLAKIRLLMGHIGDAYAPARQAFDIASANPAAGVDPLLTRLLLGRAELNDLHATDGTQLLLAALEEARTHPEVGGDAYEAAVQLAQYNALQENIGVVSPRQGDVHIAASAWSYAAAFADHASGDHALARAEALLAEGVALFNSYRQGGASFHGDLGKSVDALTEAARILAPMAAQRAGTELTIAQRDYGYALVWGRYTGAVGSHPDAFLSTFGAADASAAYCPTQLIVDPRPHYPTHAASIEREGVVVVRILIDNERATDVRVAGSIPGYWFENAVAQVAPRWQIEVPADAPSHCVMPTIRYMFVNFNLRD